MQASDLRAALDRRFLRADYATRAVDLYLAAVRAQRIAERALAAYVAFVTAAGYPRRLALRLRAGRF
jgi:hypothetical protein